MLRTRVIPCLLLAGKGLVKTTRFSQPQYIGDPINAVRIFNAKRVDELIFLDIYATREKRMLPIELVSSIAKECWMPFAVGGGINSVEQVGQILNLGSEKVIVNTYAVDNPDFVSDIANRYGSQSIVVSMDVKRLKNGSCEIFTQGGTKPTGKNPVDVAREMEARGAGELFVNSIDRDGTMMGYDIELIKSITKAVNIPVIACGGAGTVKDLAAGIHEAHASAVAAGSLFVFHGQRRAVLINFPNENELEILRNMSNK